MKRRIAAIAAAAVAISAMTSFVSVSAEALYTSGAGESVSTNWLESDITVSGNASTLNSNPVFNDKDGNAMPATPASDSTTEIKKVLVVPDDATIPDCGFTFTASVPQEDIAGTATTLPVKKGLTHGKIKWSVVPVTNNTFGTASSGTVGASLNVPYAANVVTSSLVDTDIGATTTVETADNVVIMKGETGNYYAVKEFQLDFSDIVFTEPGVYRYILTETDQTDKSNVGITVEGEDTRTLDVYVEDASYYTRTGEDGNYTYELHPTLRISKYILYTGTVTDAPEKKETASAGETPTEKFEDGSTRTGEYGFDNTAEAVSASKSVGFKNIYDTNSIRIEKQVTGNQGSRDQYFKFTLKSATTDIPDEAMFFINTAQTSLSTTLAGTAVPNDSTKYTSDVITAANTNSDKKGTYKGVADVTYFTGAQLKAGFDIYLQHDQYITIEGLPKGIEYTVSEDFEDYTAELASTGVDKTTGGSVASPDEDTTDMSLSTAGSVGTTEDTYMQGDAELVFTNKKQGVIPTGIVLSAAAPVVIGVSVIGGIVYLSLRRRREDEE